MTTRTYNAHQIDQAVKTVIIESLDFSGYDDQPVTVSHALARGKAEFEQTQGWNIKRKGYQAALAEYLQGLPSWVNIPFMNHDILLFAVEVGSLPENATEEQEDKILDNYWAFMANKLDQLFRGSRIPKQYRG